MRLIHFQADLIEPDIPASFVLMYGIYDLGSRRFLINVIFLLKADVARAI